MKLSEHAAKNRLYWDATADDYQTQHAAQLDWRKPPCWGVWERPESELQILGDVRRLEAHARLEVDRLIAGTKIGGET